MYYIFLQNDIVHETFPEKHPDFPGFPIEKRIPKTVLDQCIKWETEVPHGWLYDPETKTFSEPLVDTEGEESFILSDEDDTAQTSSKE